MRSGGKAEIKSSASYVKDRVRRIITQNLDPKYPIRNSDRLVEDLKADELDEVEIVMAVEIDFDIDITDKEASKLFTVQNYIDCVTQKVQDPHRDKSLIRP